MTSWTDLSNYAWTPFATQTLVVGVGVLLLGILVLLRERWSTEGILFWICTLTIGIWLLSFSLMYSSLQTSTALFWAKAAYLGVPFIPSAIYHFTVVVLRISSRYRRRLILSWLTAAFFAFTIITTDLLIAGLYKYSWGYYPKYEWLSVFYMVFFFGTMVLTLRHYWIETRRTEKGTRPHQRAKELLAAFGIAYFGSIDFLPKFGVSIYPAGYIFVFFFLVLAANVIWKYRLVDITPAFAADQILQTMNEPLIVCDRQGQIRIVNPAYTRLFGYDTGDIQSKRVCELSANQDNWDLKMMREGGLNDRECMFSTKFGGSVFVSLSASELKGSDGRSEGYVIVARDVTERKRMEQELKTFKIGRAHV